MAGGKRKTAVDFTNYDEKLFFFCQGQWTVYFELSRFRSRVSTVKHRLGMSWPLTLKETEHLKKWNTKTLYIFYLRVKGHIVKIDGLKM